MIFIFKVIKLSRIMEAGEPQLGLDLHLFLLSFQKAERHSWKRGERVLGLRQMAPCGRGYARHTMSPARWKTEQEGGKTVPETTAYPVADAQVNVSKTP